MFYTKHADAKTAIEEWFHKTEKANWEWFADIKKSLISVLRLRMYEMKLTQKAMAELIGISASRLNEILSGKREPTLQVARAICINLSIDASIVLGVC